MTEQWRKKAEVYKIFAEKGDFSEQAAQEMYDYETFGKGTLKNTIFGVPTNGYFIGKKFMNITLAMWQEDIEDGLLAKFELYEDGKYPHSWLNEVLKNTHLSIEGEKNRMVLYA